MSADKGIERRDWVRSFLDGDHSNVEFTAIRDHLGELIQSPADFLTVLASVRYVDRHLVIEDVQNELWMWLQSAYDLILTVQMINHEMHAPIFDWVRCHDVGQWINSLSDLMALLKWIDTGHSRVVIESLHEGQLEELIERAYEAELRTAFDKERPRASHHLLQVLQLVGDDNNRLVLEAVQGSLDKWMVSALDFDLILAFLPAEDKMWLANSLWSDKRIEQWVHSTADFNLVSKFLPSDLAEKLFEKYKSKMDEWIQSAADFHLVSIFLPSDRIKILFENYKDQMDGWVRSAIDFEQIMASLNYNGSYHQLMLQMRFRQMRIPQEVGRRAANASGRLLAELFEVIWHRVDELIESAVDFELILRHLPKEGHQVGVVFGSVGSRVGELIHTVADFDLIVRHLPPQSEVRTEVFDRVRSRAGGLIHTAAEFKLFVEHLPQPELRAEVFAMVKPRLRELIHSHSDLGDVYCLLGDTERQSLLEELSLDLEKSRRLINGIRELIEFLPGRQHGEINRAQRHEGIDSVLRIFQNIFPSGMPYSVSELRQVLRRVGPAYCIEALKLVKGQPESWMRVVYDAYFRHYPDFGLSEKANFLNSFCGYDQRVRELVLPSPSFMSQVRACINDLSPKVKDSLYMTDMKLRFQRLSEEYKNPLPSLVRETKKEVCDFLVEKTGELSQALAERNDVGIERLVKEIKERLDAINGDLGMQLKVFQGMRSRLKQAILDLRARLNYPKPLLSQTTSLAPLSIFSYTSSVVAASCDLQTESSGPSSAAGSGGGGA